MIHHESARLAPNLRAAVAGEATRLAAKEILTTLRPDPDAEDHLLDLADALRPLHYCPHCGEQVYSLGMCEKQYRLARRLARAVR